LRRNRAAYDQVLRATTVQAVDQTSHMRLGERAAALLLQARRLALRAPERLGDWLRHDAGKELRCILGTIGSQIETEPLRPGPTCLARAMIFITAKFRVRPEDADRWPEISREFTEATRAEEGCLWFDWSRSLDDPTEYVLVEAFLDGEAGGVHVGSQHFKDAQQTLPPHLAETPRIVNFEVPGTGWSELGELAVG
jgi:quinol monooxygenase YgiN